MSARVLLLVNPACRRGQSGRAEAVRALVQTGIEPIEPPTQDPLRFPDCLRAHAGRVERVIVGGGDGTLSRLIPALLQTGMTLGVLPLGTANNLARSLGIPMDLAQAAWVALGAAPRMIDVGIVNGRPFFNVAGLGLSTWIHWIVSEQEKQRWGLAAYVGEGVRLIATRAFKDNRRRVELFPVEIRCDERVMIVRTLQITVCNGRFYGAAMTISQEASLTDGFLDVCSTEVEPTMSNWLALPRILLHLKQGRYPPDSPQLRVLRCRNLHLRTRHPMPIDVDGEIVTSTPAHFRVIPQAVCVAAPAQARLLSPLRRA